MAWWTHLLFFRNQLSEEENQNEAPGENTLLALFRRAIKTYFYENTLDLLYRLLTIFTYLYLGLSIATFFFPSFVPKSFPYIIDTLSEPYLGVLGIYVIVREIELRRGKILQKRRGELFTAIWFLFFITATLLTFFTEGYYLNNVYKTVVTNALAALIIRIGTLLR